MEVGLLGTPMIVVYRVGAVTSLMGRLMIRVPHISLVNLVLGKGVMTELVQQQAEPECVEREARELLSDRDRIDGLRRGLSSLRTLLGDEGASRRDAEAVSEMLAEGDAAT